MIEPIERWWLTGDDEEQRWHDCKANAVIAVYEAFGDGVFRKVLVRNIFSEYRPTRGVIEFSVYLREEDGLMVRLDFDVDLETRLPSVEIDLEENKNIGTPWADFPAALHREFDWWKEEYARVSNSN